MIFYLGLMRRKYLGIFLIFSLWLCGTSGWSQPAIHIIDSVDQHIFTYQDIEWLEDPTGALSIGDVSSDRWAGRFQPNGKYNPGNDNKSAAYWFRIRITHNEASSKQWLLELFDQTIDSVDWYLPLTDGRFVHHRLGDRFSFLERGLWHKNFIVDVPNQGTDTRTYYLRVKSQQRADVIVVLRSESWLFHYALDEYFFFGIFYGMILVFCFYNLLMFIAVREAHYILYVLYLTAIGLYEMSADGIAYQYLWPNSSFWNTYAAGIALCAASCLSLMFTVALLGLRSSNRSMFNWALGVIALRTLLLVLSITFFESWFTFKAFELLPLGAGFVMGILCLLQGYRYARFIVVGYSCLFFGIIAKSLLYFGVQWQPFGELSHYSLGFAFILEMLFLSFAISDKIKTLLVEKHLAQERTIEQLKINEQLKDHLNEELEQQVRMKTSQLSLKSEFIERQNLQLAEANEKLAAQSETIKQMNAILSRDNDQLKHDVEEMQEARFLSRNMNFEEFSAHYPDDASCLRFIAHLKWGNGYACKRCQNDHYGEGKSSLSRRCSRCGYDESVTAYTLLQNSRLPINKALYMIFLVFSTNGSISSYKLSEILGIRQSTCWSYSSKIRKAMRHRHHSPAEGGFGWDSILLEEPQEASN
ncbi:MAG: chromosome partitioning protein ParA [Cyclobacteriaceae bacterium]|nr:chromosome partitioning protein ParA [Cyclobacteriaceae bacterium]